MAFFMLFMSSLCGIVAVQASMCYPSHPQKAVCNADLVVRGRYMGEAPLDSQQKRDGTVEKESRPYNAFRPKTIRVKLERIYKGMFVINGSVGDLIDINIGFIDDLTFKPERLYLFTGFVANDKLYTSRCDWNPLWEEVTLAQRFGLKRYFWMHCGCQIRFCPDGSCAHDPRACSWNVPSIEIGANRKDCHSKYNICVAKGSKCIWYSPKGKVHCKGPVLP